MSDAPPELSWPRKLVFLLPLALAVIELLGRASVTTQVAPIADFRRAAAFVRASFEPRDQILAAPSWTDPVVREVLGDRISLAMAGAVDLERFDRVWVVSTRGVASPLAPTRAPDLSKAFGRVHVAMWKLGESPVLFDLVERVDEAKVAIVRGGIEQDCPLVDAPVRTAGLGGGPTWPSRRHVCDPTLPWLFVAATVNEDLDLSLRRCVWQHPAGAEPVKATFVGIPLGERIVLDADLYSEHERMEEHPPFTLRVRVDGREVGLMLHRDGEGRKRLVASTQVPGAPKKSHGDVTIETLAAEPGTRTICWSAAVEGASRRAP